MAAAEILVHLDIIAEQLSAIRKSAERIARQQEGSDAPESQ